MAILTDDAGNTLVDENDVPLTDDLPLPAGPAVVVGPLMLALRLMLFAP